MPTIHGRYLHQLFINSQSVCEALDYQLRTMVEGSEFLSENAEEFALLLRNLISVIRIKLQTAYGKECFELLAEYELFQGVVNEKWEYRYKRLEKRLYIVAQLLADLTPFIKDIMGAQASINQWGVIKTVDEICKGIYPQARVMVRPRWNYTYTYYPLTFKLYQIADKAKKYDSNLYKALSDYIFPSGINTSPIFSSLVYPPIEANNILHMAIWGHEIGHFVDNIEGINEVVASGREAKPNAYISIVKSRNIPIALDSLEGKLNSLVFATFSHKGVKKIGQDLKRLMYKGITKQILDYRNHWAEEIFSDLFAVRMFGPSALFSLIEFSKPIDEWIDQTGPNHMSIRLRLKLMLDAYKKWYGWEEPDASLLIKDNLYLATLKQEIDALEMTVANRSEPIFPPSHEGIDIFQKIYPLFISGIMKVYKRLRKRVEEIYERHPERFLSADDQPLILEGVAALEASIPPDFARINSAPGEVEKRVLPLAVNAGWLYWLSKCRKKEFEKPSQIWDSNLVEDFNDINILLLKAIENCEAIKWFQVRRAYGNYTEPDQKIERRNESLERMPGILSRASLYNRLSTDLEIRPLLDPKTQIGTCSFDVRLGSTFIYAKHPIIAKLDPIELDDRFKGDLIQSKIYLPYGKPFILQPRQFVLATTLEYISMPLDLMGTVIDRESWGRLGLIMVTISKLVPGYKGCITLSLTNIGNAPIALYPLSRVGQIIFYSVH